MAKGLLPYHGLGSGIKRAIEALSDIEFKNDYERCLFTAVIQQKDIKSSPKSEISSPIGSPKTEISSLKTEDKIIRFTHFFFNPIFHLSHNKFPLNHVSKNI